MIPDGSYDFDNFLDDLRNLHILIPVIVEQKAICSLQLPCLFANGNFLATEGGI